MNTIEEFLKKKSFFYWFGTVFIPVIRIIAVKTFLSRKITIPIYKNL